MYEGTQLYSRFSCASAPWFAWINQFIIYYNVHLWWLSHREIARLQKHQIPELPHYFPDISSNTGDGNDFQVLRTKATVDLLCFLLISKCKQNSPRVEEFAQLVKAKSTDLHLVSPCTRHLNCAFRIRVWALFVQSGVSWVKPSAGGRVHIVVVVALLFV